MTFFIVTVAVILFIAYRYGIKKGGDVGEFINVNYPVEVRKKLFFRIVCSENVNRNISTFHGHNSICNESNGKFERWGFTWRTADGCTYAPEALFFNAAWFARYVYPFGVFVQIRWSGRSDRKAYLHIGIGYKLNGRFGFLLRVQSDDSSTDGAWSGVANENVSTRGWQFGPK
jgi:hypothetical protein